MPSRSNEKERSELKGGFRGNVDVNGCINALAFLYQQRGLHKGRLPQNCIEPIKYQGGLRMQFFAMTLNIIPYFSPFTYHFSLCNRSSGATHY